MFAIPFGVTLAVVLTLLATPLRGLASVAIAYSWTFEIGQGGLTMLAILVVLSGAPLIWLFTVPRSLFRLAADREGTMARWRREVPSKLVSAAGIFAGLVVGGWIAAPILGISLP